MVYQVLSFAQEKNNAGINSGFFDSASSASIWPG
jgi:hypothetical protein